MQLTTSSITINFEISIQDWILWDRLPRTLSGFLKLYLITGMIDHQEIHVQKGDDL